MTGFIIWCRNLRKIYKYRDWADQDNAGQPVFLYSVDTVCYYKTYLVQSREKAIILTSDKIFQFPHSTGCISGNLRCAERKI